MELFIRIFVNLIIIVFSVQSGLSEVSNNGFSYQDELNEMKAKDIQTTKEVFSFFSGEAQEFDLPLCLENKDINPISFKLIPESFIVTIILLEDQYFYQHEGLDYHALKDALVKNIRAGNIVRGGSTITQQLAKMIIHDYSRTVNRKVREAQLTKAIEKKYSKEDILFMYVNLLYFGHSSYGLENASQYYFNKKAEKLTELECTFLAGLISSPKKFSPIYNRKKSKERHLAVLNRYARRMKKPFQEYKTAYREFWKKHQWVDPEAYLNDFDYTIITEYE